MGVRADVQMTVKFGSSMDSIFAGTVQGMNLASEFLLGESVDRVPMDIGTLAGSGAATHTNDMETPATVSFDGHQAARLHEHPEYNFSKKSNPNAQGKWLENAAIENKSEIGNIIRAAATRGEISG